MDFETVFDLLFNKLDMQAIAAIIGICYAIQKAGVPERWMPLVPCLFGVLVAFYRANGGKDWELWAIYYAGAASVAYNVLWTTLLNKINIFDMAANILTKLGSKAKPEVKP
mgnify:CR=1 FL=1